MKMIEQCDCQLCEEPIVSIEVSIETKVLSELERSKELHHVQAFESRDFFIVVDKNGMPVYFDKEDGVDVKMQVGLNKFMNAGKTGVN